MFVFSQLVHRECIIVNNQRDFEVLGKDVTFLTTCIQLFQSLVYKYIPDKKTYQNHDKYNVYTFCKPQSGCFWESGTEWSRKLYRIQRNDLNTFNKLSFSTWIGYVALKLKTIKIYSEVTDDFVKTRLLPRTWHSRGLFTDMFVIPNGKCHTRVVHASSVIPRYITPLCCVMYCGTFG